MAREKDISAREQLLDLRLRGHLAGIRERAEAGGNAHGIGEDLQVVLMGARNLEASKASAAAEKTATRNARGRRFRLVG